MSQQQLSKVGEKDAKVETIKVAAKKSRALSSSPYNIGKNLY